MNIQLTSQSARQRLDNTRALSGRSRAEQSNRSDDKVQLSEGEYGGTQAAELRKVAFKNSVSFGVSAAAVSGFVAAAANSPSYVGAEAFVGVASALGGVLAAHLTGIAVGTAIGSKSKPSADTDLLLGVGAGIAGCAVGAAAGVLGADPLSVGAVTGLCSAVAIGILVPAR